MKRETEREKKVKKDRKGNIDNITKKDEERNRERKKVKKDRKGNIESVEVLQIQMERGREREEDRERGEGKCGENVRNRREKR
jgi:hypothetical protein